MRNFRDYDIWKDSMELVRKVYVISDNLPLEEKYGLRSQIQRCAVSIPSNIAEGASRSSEIEFRRFLEISLGSSFELETQLLIINDIFQNNDLVGIGVFDFLKTIQKKLNALITKINNDYKN